MSDERGDTKEILAGRLLEERYRVVRKLGRGGMATVYLARDERMERDVVLKIPHAQFLLQEGFRERFEREIVSLTRLEHPHIVSVLDVGSVDGAPFAVLQYLGGGSLKDHIEKAGGALPERHVQKWLPPVAATLDFIHGTGIVHRDVKGGNILFDANGNVFVADFGIAKALGSGDTKLTQTGGTPGSPEYMAPEVMLGKKLGPAYDQYSLAVVVYEALSGVIPHAGETPLAILYSKTNQPAQHLRELVPGARAGAADAVMRALSMSPGDRFESCTAFAAAFRAGRPAPTPPPAPAPRVARKRGRLVGGGALVVALLVALAFWIGRDRSDAPASPDREPAVRRAWRLIADRKFDEAIAILRRAHDADASDTAAAAALASACEGAGGVAEAAGDWWSAQTHYGEAHELEPTHDRANAFARTREGALEALEAIAVRAPPIAARPLVTIEAGEVPLAKIVVAGRPLEPSPKVEVELTVEEGSHEVEFQLVDRAGNERSGKLGLTVDRTNPVVELLAPGDDVEQRSRSLTVRVRVEDAHPPPTIAIGREEVPLAEGVAEHTFELDDGTHRFRVEAIDRAGNRAETEFTVTVDSKAPELTLAATRVVTDGAPVRIRGKVAERAVRLTVDGAEARVRDDGSFDVALEAEEDRAVSVVAIGTTGLTSRATVKVVVDREPPEVRATWKRRDASGALLFGRREIKRGQLEVALANRDETEVSFEPSEGEMRMDRWLIPARPGRRTVQVRFRDEAGHAGELTLALDGRDATPRLVVRCPLEGHTRSDRVQLDIDADEPLTLQGKPVAPGRQRLSLPEGPIELVVRAADAWGNESIWKRALVVDRTPPDVRLLEGTERGAGDQDFVFEANEPLATVTCFAQTIEGDGNRATVTAELKPGTRRLAVTARDVAGNVSRKNFTLRVRNRYLQLDGKSAIQIPRPKSWPGSEFTIEFWVRSGEPTKKYEALLSDFRDDAGLALMWSGKVRGPHVAWYAEGAGVQRLVVGRDWRWKRWTHFACCYDGNKMRIFVDGAPRDAISAELPVRASQAPIYLGADPARRGAESFFVGHLDEVRLSSVSRYTRRFTPDRFHRRDAETIVLYRFDKTLRKGFLDSSSNARHGIGVGAPKLLEDDG